MRVSMLNRKSLLFLGVVIALVAAMASIIPFGGGNAVAQNGFSNASFVGTYAFTTAHGSPDEAAIGQLTADGQGNITSGILRLNVPTSVLVPGAPGRSVVPATVTEGSYSINADGSGNASATVDTAAGVLVRNFEFVISQVDGSTATEIHLSQVEPTLAGGLGYFVVKRISD